MVIISDDFPGLNESIKEIFPLAEHQLCYIHLQRNIKRNMGKQDAKEFKEELKKIMASCKKDEEAVEKFNLLIEKYENFMRKLETNKERYFTFKK